MRAAALVLVIAAGCGGTVVDDVALSSSSTGSSGTGSSSTGSGETTGTTSAAGVGGAGGDATTSDATTAGATGGAPPVTTSTSGAGGAPPDGACIAPDYCACIATPSCRVVAEDCFCPCDEPCSEPCDCDCGGGAFYGCAPGSIFDPGALDTGVWLVGWSGGLNHFSWVRFETDQRLTVLDGADLSTNAPYFPCSGEGSWAATGEPETVALELPAGCEATILTFEASTPFPPGSLQEASVVDRANEIPIGAWRYPDDVCAADLSACEDPFLP